MMPWIKCCKWEIMRNNETNFHHRIQCYDCFIGPIHTILQNINYLTSLNGWNHCWCCGAPHSIFTKLISFSSTNTKHMYNVPIFLCCHFMQRLFVLLISYLTLEQKKNRLRNIRKNKKKITWTTSRNRKITGTAHNQRGFRVSRSENVKCQKWNRETYRKSSEGEEQWS